MPFAINCGGMPSDRQPFQSRAVRALVLLHETHMRQFVETWRRARAASLVLPVTSDPSYASLDTLAHHVFGAARHYMMWICEQLRLPAPDISPEPEPTDVAGAADRYLDQLLDGWRTSLRSVRDDQLESPEYPSEWQTRYSIDAMLEHAVMHPIRHTFQLEELMDRRRRVGPYD